MLIRCRRRPRGDRWATPGLRHLPGPATRSADRGVAAAGEGRQYPRGVAAAALLLSVKVARADGETGAAVRGCAVWTDYAKSQCLVTTECDLAPVRRTLGVLPRGATTPKNLYSALILTSEFAVLRCQVRLFRPQDHLASTTAAVIGRAVAMLRSLLAAVWLPRRWWCIARRTGLRIIPQSL